MKIKLSSIKAKLWVMSLGMAFFYIGLGVISIYQLSKLDSSTTLVDPFHDLNIQIIQLENLSNQVLNLSSENTQNNVTSLNNELQTNLERAINLVQVIKENKLVRKNQELWLSVEEIERIISNFKEKSDALNEALANYINYSLNGRLSTLGTSLKTVTYSLGSIQLKEQINQVLIDEKLYFLQRDTSIINSINLNLVTMKDLVYQDSTIIATFDSTDFSKRDAFTKYLDEYLAELNVLAEKDVSLGVSNKAGLVPEIKKITTQAKAEITKALKIATDIRVQQTYNSGYIFSIVVFFVTLFITILSIYISRSITNPIVRIKNYVLELSKGYLPTKFKLKNDDEITEMLKSLNTFVDNLREKSKFASSIGDGKLNMEYKALGKDDILGNALIEMKNSLLKADEEESRRKNEDEKRSWATNGSARFGDLLRQYSSDLVSLARHSIVELVQYLDANQGGFFVLNDQVTDSEPLLQMVAAFAYNRERHIKKEIELGEGLIGTCAVERKTIFLTEIPEKYITITSGLGEALPRCLLIVPLISNGQLYGIVEIASLKVFEDYQVEFVEQIAEDIASTLATVKVNLKTTLLLEQSKRQAEELSSQEEEMRQNMEELQATQEESSRREQEMKIFINSLNSSAFVMLYSTDGEVLSVNNVAEATLGLSEKKLTNTYYLEYLDDTFENLEEYKNLWDKIKIGTTIKKVSKKKIGNNTIWLDETFSPIYDSEGRITKVLNISFDITKQREKENYLHNENNRIKKMFQMVDSYVFTSEVKSDGIIISLNENFASLLGSSMELMVGKNISEVAPENLYLDFAIAREGIITGNNHESKLELLGLKMKFFYRPVLDQNNELDLIILTGFKIDL